MEYAKRASSIKLPEGHVTQSILSSCQLNIRQRSAGMHECLVGSFESSFTSNRAPETCKINVSQCCWQSLMLALDDHMHHYMGLPYYRQMQGRLWISIYSNHDCEGQGLMHNRPAEPNHIHKCGDTDQHSTAQRQTSLRKPSNTTLQNKCLPSLGLYNFIYPLGGVWAMLILQDLSHVCWHQTPAQCLSHLPAPLDDCRHHFSCCCPSAHLCQAAAGQQFFCLQCCVLTCHA